MTGIIEPGTSYGAVFAMTGLLGEFPSSSSCSATCSNARSARRALRPFPRRRRPWLSSPST
ncbi:hypothetical protein ABFY27_11020 [Akkermansia massiliensis]